MSKKSKVKQADDGEAMEITKGVTVVDAGSADEADGGVRLASPGKRKRETNDEDIEIDLDMPEPPNKKALRKARKMKKAGKSDEEIKEMFKAEAKTSPEPEANGSNDAEARAQDESAGAVATKASRPKATHSIWIGNLPFSATKAMVTDFLINNSQPTIPKASITRVNVPAPANAKATKTTIKPMNKGFAYVDFSDQQSFMAACALSETSLAGRNVLIKDAKSFEGRPVEHQAKQHSGTNKVVSRRVFLGNLGFDVTVEDLEHLFGKCGTIENVHMATFEDSGKCKGFAWITFATDEAAKAAVKGVVVEVVERDQVGDEDAEDDHKKPERKPKKRQWWCNRLRGREIRREFAEDSSVRYNKRFGKGSRNAERTEQPIEEVDRSTATEQPQASEPKRHRHSSGINPGAPTDHKKRRGRTDDALGKASRDEKAKELAERTQYRTGQVAESQGTKITFE